MMIRGLFTWESVVLGYVCGSVVGVSLRCLMFSTGKPNWIVRIVNAQRRGINSLEIEASATRRNKIRKTGFSVS